MRYGICALTVLVCLGAITGIAHLHGYERALGREEWRYESRLVEAYAGEIPFHAGPSAVLLLAALVGIRSVRAQRQLIVAAVVVAALALFETYEAERAYILASPGQLVAPPDYCDLILTVLWLGAVGALGGAVICATRRRGHANGAG